LGDFSLDQSDCELEFLRYPLLNKLLSNARRRRAGPGVRIARTVPHVEEGDWGHRPQSGAVGGLLFLLGGTSGAGGDREVPGEDHVDRTSRSSAR